MRFKSFKLFPVVILITLLSLFLFGCGKQGSRFGNKAPTISITSYEGYDPSVPFTDSTEVTLFQQKIFWHAIDTDGVVNEYAYRILNDNDEPIRTAGNTFLDMYGEVDKAAFDKFGGGWVLHYKPGANQSIPLDSTGAKRTIWTTQKYAVVNFSANYLGEADTTISKFQVICRDNRKTMCTTYAVRRFKSTSARPTCMLSTTKGDPAGDQVGTGIRLSFTLDDGDPYIQPTAWYYQFKIEKVNKTTEVVESTTPANGWISTERLPKINEYLLTRQTNPSLSSDFNAAGTQVTYTRVIAKVVDLAGVISLPDTITFAVKEGFHPSTLVHMKRVFALGNNHYIDYNDDSTPEVLPSTITNGQFIYATPFFKDVDGFYTAISSNNLKSWIRWGWHGEYGKPNENSTTITDDPYDKKVDKLLDEDTNLNYYSEITDFDLRLDNLPYNYPPYANSVIEDPGTHKKWLRVPVNSSLGQTIVLTNLPVNTEANPYHFFEVRAVDLQGEVDPSPAEFKFKILPIVPKSQQQGILVIDDDVPSSTYSPGQTVDDLYAGYFAGTGYTPTVYHYGDSQTIEDLNPDIKSRRLALSDLQKYKLVIFHSERPDKTSDINYENDGIALYLKQGGNMLIAINGSGAQSINAYALAYRRTMNQYFGVPFVSDGVKSISSFTKPFFQKALGQAAAGIAFSDINVNLQGFNSIVNARQGLYSVSYFPTYDAGANVTYKFGCKPTTSSVNPPSSADFSLLNNQPVGLRKAGPNNKCYIVGFPLSYMVNTEATDFIHKVVTDIMQ